MEKTDSPPVGASRIGEWTANEMLDSIVGSLRGYPHCGGDIGVMTEVDRIVREATERDAKIARLAREYVAAHTTWLRDYNPERCADAADAQEALIAAVQEEGKCTK